MFFHSLPLHRTPHIVGDHLKIVDVCACMGIPDTGSILHDRSSTESVLCIVEYLVAIKATLWLLTFKRNCSKPNANYLRLKSKTFR